MADCHLPEIHVSGGVRAHWQCSWDVNINGAHGVPLFLNASTHVIWRRPFRHGGSPSYPWIFHEINHPAIWIANGSHVLGNPHIDDRIRLINIFVG